MRSVQAIKAVSGDTLISKRTIMKTLITTLALVFAASFTQAQDFSNVTSGMLLGIYSHPSNGGMQVTSLIPGYSAQGRLFPGDILLRATVDGYTVYNLRSQYEMENAKRSIGANREAAIEIYRPGQGLDYIWVQFTTIYGPAGAPTAAYSTPAKRTYGAQFRTEREKPGAQALFQRNGSGGGQLSTGQVTTKIRSNKAGSSTAKLFGR
jgi:hypothetical protein